MSGDKAAAAAADESCPSMARQCTVLYITVQHAAWTLATGAEPRLLEQTPGDI